MRVKNIVVLAIACVCCGVLAALLLPPLSVRQAAARTQMLSNACRITMAMRAYSDRYGTLPPAVSHDRHGRPMHSWRALLLPFLDQRRLAGLYNFNEPWDSAANLPLLKEIPDVFASQGDRTKGSGTGFVVVVGEGTAFPTAGAAGVEAFGEPLTSHNLALIVAVERSGIGWTEPRDAELDVRSLPPRISLASDDLLSHLDIPVVAGFADGSARPIGDGLPRDAFAKYFTLSRNGH